MDKYNLFWSAFFAFLFVGDSLITVDYYINYSDPYFISFFFLEGLVCLLVSMYNMAKAVEPRRGEYDG